MSTIVSSASSPSKGIHDQIGRSEPTQIPMLPRERWIFFALLMVGAALLLFRFPAVPVGLHQDEMSEAYESWALLHTGADRWGYRLPVYFLSWGSGQNVLQAYLNIPFVAVMGLTRLSARLLPMLLNLACLPLFFVAVRRWYGNRPALLALAFLALSPWHIMLSRWGIENSPLPFFLALGLCTFGWASESTSPWRIVPSFVPFALAMYTYGIPIVVLPILVVLWLWLGLPAVRRSPWAWMGAVSLFAIMVAPLALFTVKNYVAKRNFAFERLLPVSIPLLPRSRLNEAEADLNAHSILHHNARFFALQMSNEHLGVVHLWSWYQLPDVRSVQTVIYLLFGLGFAVLLFRTIAARRPMEPFVPWVLSCGYVVAAIPLNVSRAGILYLPLLALASYGFFFILGHLKTQVTRSLAWAVLTAFVIAPLLRFIPEYYGASYRQQLASSFYPHLPEAIVAAESIAGPRGPIYFSQDILLNYVDVLFYKRIDPSYFQHSGATWDHPDFGRFYFHRTSLQTIPHPFVYVVPDWQAAHKYANDPPICPHLEQMADLDELKVGICR